MPAKKAAKDTDAAAKKTAKKAAKKAVAKKTPATKSAPKTAKPKVASAESTPRTIPTLAQLQEAAYFHYLSRIQSGSPGDPGTDWAAAVAQFES